MKLTLSHKWHGIDVWWCGLKERKSYSLSLWPGSTRMEVKKSRGEKSSHRPEVWRLWEQFTGVRGAEKGTLDGSSPFIDPSHCFLLDAPARPYICSSPCTCFLLLMLQHILYYNGVTELIRSLSTCTFVTLACFQLTTSSTSRKDSPNCIQVGRHLHPIL